jgi:hypothetical protein
LNAIHHLDEMPIPIGWRIYEPRLYVAGLSFRQRNALAFCKASSQSLEFQLEPTNVHDSNAIQINGCWPGIFFQAKKHIGFVERATAANIAVSGLGDILRPRLLSTYFSGRYTEVGYQIIGPKVNFSHYRDCVNLRS